MTTYYLSPVSTMQFEDANGVPNSGAQLFTYQAGTTTKQATYKTNAGTANTNPIILDSKGRPPFPIWTEAGTTFRYFLATAADTDPPAGAAIWEIDNVVSTNDTTNTINSEWIVSSLTPTYVNATSFSLVGDQTTDFHVNRRVRALVSGVYKYGSITSSTFAAGVTTVALNITSLTAGLTEVSYGIISAFTPTHPGSALPSLVQEVRAVYIESADGINFTSASGGDIGGSVDNAANQGGLIDGQIIHCELNRFSTYAYNTSTSPTFSLNDYGAKSIYYISDDNDITPIPVGAVSLFKPITLVYSASADVWIMINNHGQLRYEGGNYKRHAIIQAPTLSGVTSLGYTPGSTSITTTSISESSPLVVNAANMPFAQGRRDLVGYCYTNMTWTGLSTNGKYYLYVDIDYTGKLTAGSTTLQPVYQWYAAPSATSGQCTFNVSEMTMYVGNGSDAAQMARVFIGEATVSGSVVSSVAWYAINGRYESAWTDTLPAAASLTTFTHNLGYYSASGYNSHGIKWALTYRNKTTELNYATGDIVHDIKTSGTSAAPAPLQMRVNGLTCLWRQSSTGIGALPDATSGVITTIPTAANWSYKITVERDW